ncbi:hypothetical protein B2I21_00415, partial [Chryseobacterium mucoviscidosis]
IPESDKFHSTRSNILRFYSTRDVSVLGQMKYSEVQELLSNVKNEKTNKKKLVDVDNDSEDSDNSLGKSKRKPDSPESTA